MEPITAIVTALALGAATGLKPIAEQAIKDSYAALKALISRKYAQVPLDQLEANPSSKSRRGVVEEDLAAAQADHDPEVLQHAQALLEAIQRQEPHTAVAIGIDLQDIAGAALAIRRITATGTGVKVEQATMTGDITIEDVRAGESGGPPQTPSGSRSHAGCRPPT